jgi:hypothetical protein
MASSLASAPLLAEKTLVMFVGRIFAMGLRRRALAGEQERPEFGFFIISLS